MAYYYEPGEGVALDELWIFSGVSHVLRFSLPASDIVLILSRDPIQKLPRNEFFFRSWRNRVIASLQHVGMVGEKSWKNFVSKNRIYMRVCVENVIAKNETVK